jgi:predicted MFS family arabinose efflux permease
MSQYSHILMWLIASIFYAYQYILRVMPSIMLEDIMSKFNIAADSFGQFSGLYYIGYSLMHLPLGIALDRIGPRKVMPICILLCVAGTLPIIYADSWFYPVVGRFLVGAGSSAAILGAFKIIRMVFDEQKFTRMLSLCVSVGLCGAIYGGGPLNYMCSEFGYIAVVQILSALGILLAAITYFCLPDTQPTESEEMLSDIWQVVSNKSVLLICFSAGMMVGPIEGFADVWGSIFFKNVYNLDSNLAASLPSTIFIGMCFGAPLLGIIAEKTNYLGTIIISGLVMSATFFSFLFFNINIGFLSLAFALTGICCAYQIIAIYYASTCVPERVAGLTNAMANMIIMSFGYAFHSIIGYVVTIMGGINSPGALVYGICVIPIALLIGSLGFVSLIKVKIPPEDAKIA